ncbi:MAG TPA: SDR family NAD(P)-dependent oxidoreductase [Solirubrobacteraceae bacterium]|jgi:NAD(P)-dependent dehydrogenase (short-subunit alcohol dehydrogenase family)|nr:SDR family NAD(P)-dependent oxidoreductase [Solirubrobacteraceae bacterium]
MSAPASKAVLITGCSTGIGRAAAQRLAQRGWTVYASARRQDSIADLADGGCRLLQLDVTDEASMSAAVETVQSEHGAVGVLVNNAGYSQGGPLEQVPMDAVRRQFETNVFGPIRLSQLVLPAMREQRWGRIVNIGSMGGRLTFPGGALYHATKHSLEAISDALRFEVAGFGIGVTLIEPGLITSDFAKTAVATVADAQTAGEDPYGEFNAKLAAMTVGVYESPIRHLGGSPEVVAKAIEKAITRRRAPTRMLLTASGHLTVLQRKLLPDRLWDAAMRSQLPQPR